MKTKMIRICTVLAAVTVLGTTGCTHARNKSWSDMTDAERAETKEEFQEIRKELAEELLKDSLEYGISNVILSEVEEYLEED